MCNEAYDSFYNPMNEVRDYTFLPYFCALKNMKRIQLEFLVIVSRRTFAYLCGFVKLNILFSCFYMIIFNIIHKRINTKFDNNRFKILGQLMMLFFPFTMLEEKLLHR